MPKAIKITRHRSQASSYCEECGGPGHTWTRERARQHADQKRHTVHFVIEDTTIYAPKDTP